MFQRLLRSRRDEQGASAVEYGLLVAAIAAVILVSVFALGTFVKGEFDTTCSQFNTQPVGGVTQTCP